MRDRCRRYRADSFQHGLRTEAVQQGEEALLGSRAFSRRAGLGQFSFESFGAQSLATAPAAGIRYDFVDAIVEGDRTGVRLEGEAPADIAVRNTITVAIEVHPEIFMHQGLDGVTMVIRDNRQGPQRVRLKPVDGPLASFPVLPLVGHFSEPLPRLAIYVVQIGKLAQRPETLAGFSPKSCVPRYGRSLNAGRFRIC